MLIAGGAGATSASGRASAAALGLAPSPGAPIVPDLPGVPALRAIALDRRPVTARAVRSMFYYRRIIACCLLALAIVAGLWMVLRAIGGVAGGGSLTSPGPPGPASASAESVGASTAGAHPTQGQVWIVRPGDTLWSIVAAAGVKGDPRPVVDKLSAALGDQPLQAGEAVAVP